MPESRRARSPNKGGWIELHPQDVDKLRPHARKMNAFEIGFMQSMRQKLDNGYLKLSTKQHHVLKKIKEKYLSSPPVNPKSEKLTPKPVNIKITSFDAQTKQTKEWEEPFPKDGPSLEDLPF